MTIFKRYIKPVGISPGQAGSVVMIVMLMMFRRLRGLMVFLVFVLLVMMVIRCTVVPYKIARRCTRDVSADSPIA